jgi:hypothetical protein
MVMMMMMMMMMMMNYRQCCVQVLVLWSLKKFFNVKQLNVAKRYEKQNSQKVNQY